jgi:hypothetical protein
MDAGIKIASQNNASAARNVLGMWLSLNSRSKAEADFASDCITLSTSIFLVIAMWQLLESGPLDCEVADILSDGFWSRTSKQVLLLRGTNPRNEVCLRTQEFEVCRRNTQNQAIFVDNKKKKKKKIFKLPDRFYSLINIYFLSCCFTSYRTIDLKMIKI